MRSAELDDNRDGLKERLELSVNMPLETHELIYGFSAIVLFDCKLSSMAKYTFDSVAYINYESGTPMNELKIDGDMIFQQSGPLTVFGGYTALYTNDPLVAISTTMSASDVSFETIMSKFTARNCK